MEILVSLILFVLFLIEAKITSFSAYDTERLSSFVFKLLTFVLFLGINDIGANMLWPVDDFDNSRVHGRRWTRRNFAFA